MMNSFQMKRNDETELIGNRRQFPVRADCRGVNWVRGRFGDRENEFAGAVTG